MTDILSDERLAEIREEAEACYRWDRGFEAEAHHILSLLARLDKAEGRSICGIRETPAPAPEAGKFGGPPPGYHPLPEGAACRCPKLWQDGKGNHWCCLPVSSGRNLADAT